MKRSISKSGVGFGSHGSRCCFPGNIILVSTAIPGIAITAVAAAFDTQFQRRQPGLPADQLSRCLVGGHAHLDVRTAGLLRMRAGQERGRGPRVISGAIAVGTAAVDRQTAATEQQTIALNKLAEAAADGAAAYARPRRKRKRVDVG